MAETIVYAVARWSRKTLHVEWVRVTETREQRQVPRVGNAALTITQVVGAFLADRQKPGQKPGQTVLIRNMLENITGVPRGAIALVEVDRG